MSNNLPPGFPPGMTFNFFNGNGLDPLQFQSGIDSNNSAVAAALSGQTDVAIARHREALKMKLRVHGPNAIITAITYNGLGESLLEAGELQEAEEMLLNAYRVREGSGNGDNFDAAVTRENLGRLYEAKGDWARARSVRMEGSTRGRNSFACSNDKCPGQTFPLSRMSHCSACQTPLYCSKECQKIDWAQRHKALCKSREASA